MSTHGSNALQPEGSGSTSYNNQNSPRGKKRESSEELVTLGAKKRRVEQVS
jgi:hypothetical protein